MKISFFTDNQGNPSSTRIIVAALVAYAMAMGVIAMLNEGHVACIAVVTSITGLAAGWKLGQNAQERKS